jgi:hypothetical protein
VPTVDNLVTPRSAPRSGSGVEVDPLLTRWSTAVVGENAAMEFLDPRSAPLAPVEPYRGRAPLVDGDTVGLFANGFPDSVAFLEHVGAALQRAVPGLEVKAWNKGNASALASQQHLGEIQAECTAVVAAYGH